MKRGIRDMKKPAQSKQETQAEELYRMYSGKSEQELMATLQNMTEEERTQLGALQQELAPMLSASQQEKLAAIIRSLTNGSAVDRVRK